MTSYEKIWDFAEDHYGLITASQAESLGVNKHYLPGMARRGTLLRKGHGVYLAKHHIPQENDVYAHSVAIVGDTAYLRGASVVALLRLAPTNPAVIYVGAAGRVRRKMPTGIRLRDMTPCDCVEYERIKCQNLFAALRAAKTDGAIEADRIADAACKALSRGLLSENEAKEFFEE